MGRKATTSPFVVDCCEPLRTTSPRELERTYRSVWATARKAYENPAPGGEAHFDLSKRAEDELDPGGILLLMHVAWRLDRVGWTCYVTGKGSANDKLGEHLNYYFTRREDRGKLPRKAGRYPLRDIADKRHASAELADWSDMVRKDTKAGEEQAARWEFQISEAITNAFQHGVQGVQPPMHPSLVAGELVRYEQKELVQLAALDFGATIPKVVSTADRAPASARDGRLVQFATKDGVTSRSHPSNQGRGLADVVRAATSCGGSLQILSRNGLAYVEPGETRVRQKTLKPGRIPDPILQGTLVVVNLQTT